MTQDMLKQWAAGTLSHSQERDVARWMVRCTDPELPRTLHGILREQRESAADVIQSRLGQAWQQLVDTWDALLDAGSAGWTQPGMGLQVASLQGPAEQADALVLSDDQVAVAVAGDEPVIVVVTDAQGAVIELPRSSDGPTKVPTDLQGRPTVWLIRGHEGSVGTVEELHTAVTSPTARVTALRWRD